MHNPFELFGLPVQFQIDQALLSERYLSLQKELHPDNFANHSSAEQRLAIEKSADVNQALQILKDPILRAEEIIKIHTGKEKNLEEKSMKDIDFLMQQMEWYEKLEAIEHQQNEEELFSFLKFIQTEQKYVLQQLENALEEAEWAIANALTDKLRYFKKLIFQIEKVEEKLLNF